MDDHRISRRMEEEFGAEQTITFQWCALVHNPLKMSHRVLWKTNSVGVHRENRCVICQIGFNPSHKFVEDASCSPEDASHGVVDSIPLTTSNSTTYAAL